MENFSLGLNVYGSHLYVSKYFICWSSVCPWALGKGKGCSLPNIYYLKIPTFFQTRYIFVTNVQSTHQKVYYYSWLQLMTYFFSSTEARKIFSSCRIISGGFIGCLFHPPLHFVAKSPKKNPVYFPFLSGFINLNMLEKVCIFLKK